MTTEQQILKILKEENKPLKAIEIADKFSIYFNEVISKKEVNQIIYRKLKREVNRIGFPRYTYSLIEEDVNLFEEKSINNKHAIQNEINFDNSNDKPATEWKITLLDEVYKLIDEYVVDFHEFRKNKDITVRDACLIKVEVIIEYIIFNNLNIDKISKYLETEDLVHNQIIGDEKIIKFYKESHLQDDHKEILLYSSTLDTDLLALIKKYESTYSDFVKLSRKPSNIKFTFSELINELEERLSEFIDLIVKNILTNNISLTDVENNCSRDLYVKIENNNDIYSWVSRKDEDQSIDLDTYKDRLKEFKILCKKVWEDGVVDVEEQIEIDERIISLVLEKEDANEIFEQIKGEYKELHLLDNFKEQEDVKKEVIIFDDKIIIDSKIFYIKITDQPMSPLFWHKFEEGLEIIYINKFHNQYNAFELPQLKKIIVAICVTKLSFSSNQGDIFESRFKNYLELL